MGLFTKDVKIKPGYRAPESIEAGKKLRGLIQQPYEFPTRTVAVSPLMQLIQAMTASQLGAVNTSSEMARGAYADVLGGDYDPMTGMQYKGLRDELERMKTGAITSQRQRAESLGGLRSTPAAGVESATGRQYDTMIAQVIGDLLEKERDRKLQAAQGIQQSEAQTLANIGSLQGLAEYARSVEQQRADALYAQQMQQMLFPYQDLAQIELSMLGYQQPMVVTGGGAKDWVTGVSAFAPIIGGALAGGMFSGGGGTSGPATVPRTSAFRG